MNRFPTGCALRRRGCYIVSRCSLCQAKNEMTNHLFIYCPYSLGLWDFIMNLFRKQLVLYGSLKDLVFLAIQVKLSHQIYA